MSEAPAELWLRQNDAGDYYVTSLRDAVRYVRADLYEAALARLAVVRSWNEAPCLEPFGEGAMRRLSWRKLWRGLGALLDFGPYRPL